MKEDILNLLLTTDNYISGEDISNILGVTRACIWKHIKTLKKDGYVIEGISNKGYKLISCPLGLSLPELKKLLINNDFYHNILLFDEINSTNLYAKKIASEGAPNNTLILAKTQNNGVGRLQREWSSPNGGLWCSIILRPSTLPMNAGKIPLIAAASIYNTLSKLDFPCKIKWPNDILINSKKVCGILTEMNCELDKINYVVLGIGINVNIKNIEESLKDKATSLFLYKNEELNINLLLKNLLCEFSNLYNEFLNTNEIPTSIKICKENSSIIGKHIIISNYKGKETVSCIDLSPMGSLIVKDNDNNIKEILSGEISLSENYK